MVNVVITGHGGREGGTSEGTYIVPKNVTIYFFTRDGTVLYEDASDALMDKLCCAHPNEVLVQAAAVQVKRQFEKVPNYKCFGTTDFRDASGAYQVGVPPSHASNVVRIPDGQEKTLSAIIGGKSTGGVIGTCVYWLCCRAAPDNSNNIDDDSDVLTGQLAFGGQHAIGAVEVGSSAGLKPSQVKQLGSWR